MAYVLLSINVTIINHIKVAGFESKEVARKLKFKMAYVSLSVNVTIINHIKVAGFESKEQLRSSEIKEDGLGFVEHQRDDHQPYQSRWF